MERSKKIVIWPVNLDALKSRAEGRLIPKQIAIPSPKLEEIENAANELKLKPEKAGEKAYPKTWWEKSGYIRVEKVAAKSKIVKQIAQKIGEKRTRSAGAGTAKPKKK